MFLKQEKLKPHCVIGLGQFRKIAGNSSAIILNGAHYRDHRHSELKMKVVNGPTQDDLRSLRCFFSNVLA